MNSLPRYQPEYFTMDNSERVRFVNTLHANSRHILLVL